MAKAVVARPATTLAVEEEAAAVAGRRTTIADPVAGTTMEVASVSRDEISTAGIDQVAIEADSDPMVVMVMKIMTL